MIMAVKAKWIGLGLLSLTLCCCGGNKQPQAPRENAATTEPATPGPTSLDPQTVIDTRPVIVAFGDSLTAGYGVEPGKSYPDDLQRTLDAAGYKYHVENQGVSGDTTTDGIQRLPEVLAAKPEIVILEFGGNDGLRGLPVSTTRTNLTQMIQAFRQAGIRILLAGMTLPKNYGPTYIQSFEKVYIDLATQFHLPRIPFLLQGLVTHPEMIQQDGIHPTAQGCQIVSATVLNYLTPLLKK